MLFIGGERLKTDELRRLICGVIRRSSNEERLPSASTCFNVLKLPNYKRSATMKEKVKYAVTSGAGFELS